MAPLGGPEVRALGTAVPGGEHCDGQALPVAASKSRKKEKKKGKYPEKQGWGTQKESSLSL